MFGKKKFIIGGILVALALGYLGVSSLADAATYYYNVAEVIAQKQSLTGQKFRIDSHVLEGSVHSEPGSQTIEFYVAEPGSSDSIRVVYTGVIPDAFKDGIQVVVEGSLEEDGIFYAQTVLTRCPSKYEPEIVQE